MGKFVICFFWNWTHTQTQDAKTLELREKRTNDRPWTSPKRLKIRMNVTIEKRTKDMCQHSSTANTFDTDCIDKYLLRWWIRWEDRRCASVVCYVCANMALNKSQTPRKAEEYTVASLPCAISSSVFVFVFISTLNISMLMTHKWMKFKKKKRKLNIKFISSE